MVSALCAAALNLLLFVARLYVGLGRFAQYGIRIVRFTIEARGLHHCIPQLFVGDCFAHERLQVTHPTSYVLK